MRIPHFLTQISSKINSNFSPTATDSSQRKKIPYICGLRARIEVSMEANIQPTVIESQI